jgi:hypothetical protein
MGSKEWIWMNSTGRYQIVRRIAKSFDGETCFVSNDLTAKRTIAKRNSLRGVLTAVVDACKREFLCEVNGNLEAVIAAAAAKELDSLPARQAPVRTAPLSPEELAKKANMAKVMELAASLGLTVEDVQNKRKKSATPRRLNPGPRKGKALEANGLRRVQNVILRVLRNAGSFMSRADMKAEAGQADISVNVGCIEPKHRADLEAKLGFPSLLGLGMVQVVDVDGRHDYAITDKGLEAIAKLDGPAKEGNGQPAGTKSGKGK